MDDLNKAWKASKPTLQSADAVLPQIYHQASMRKRSIIIFHTANIIILSLTLLVLVSGRIYLDIFRDALSQAGIMLMMIVLFARIVIEVYSMMAVRSLSFSDQTTSMTTGLLKMYSKRRIIHGPVTIGIIVLYLVGLAMLMPEWRRYFELNILLLMNAGFLISGLFIIFQTRKSIAKELNNISEMIDLQKQMSTQ
jgi:hypothetical protein